MTQDSAVTCLSHNPWPGASIGWLPPWFSEQNREPTCVCLEWDYGQL